MVGGGYHMSIFEGTQTYIYIFTIQTRMIVQNKGRVAGGPQVKKWGYFLTYMVHYGGHNMVYPFVTKFENIKSRGNVDEGDGGYLKMGEGFI